MAGHSHFKNMMHRKGAQDAKRARQFARLIREITVAAGQGLPDPAFNPRLRAAVAAAIFPTASSIGMHRRPADVPRTSTSAYPQSDLHAARATPRKSVSPGWRSFLPT